MAYPPFEEYQEAMRQPPQDVFSDPVLASGHVTKLWTGEPRVLSGNFALTYQVVTARGTYAVRCFHKASEGLEQRYEALRHALGQSPRPFFVGFEYQPKGILTESGWHPVVRMDWADGLTLGAWVAERRRDATALQQLRTSLRDLARELSSLGIAHGDIQPANFIVRGRSDLRLVDYDGMFVPELAGLDSIELGQRNFQHPGRRASHFDGRLDAFPFAVMDLALAGLAQRPDLWEATSSDESAWLLRGEDYANPWSSLPFGRLREIAGLDLRTKQFAAICQSSYEEIPAFEDILAGRNIPTPRQRPAGAAYSTQRPIYLPAFPVVDASNFAQCCTRIGDRVEIVGRIRRVQPLDVPDVPGGVLRVEFGAFPDDMAVLQIDRSAWSERDPRQETLHAGDWISATGLVEPPRIERVDAQACKTVSLQITHRSQVTKLEPDEARHRLTASTRAFRPFADAASGRVGTDPAHPDATAVMERLVVAPEATAVMERLVVEPEATAVMERLVVEPEATAVMEQLVVEEPHEILAARAEDSISDAAVTLDEPAEELTALARLGEAPSGDGATPTPAAVERSPAVDVVAETTRAGSSASPPMVAPPLHEPLRSATPQAEDRPRPNRWMAWTAAAVVGLLLLMLLRNDDEGSPAPERTAEAEPLPGNPALVPGTANPVPGEEQTEPSEVIEPDSEAPVSTATAPTRTRSLRSVRLPVSTRNGPLTIVRRSGGDVLRLDGDDLGESLARAITLVHQAHYSDREVITGYSGCDAPGPGCRGRVPFWLVLRDNGRAEYRELDEVAASGELPDVVALASGVHVDLGVRDGVRRTAMLTALDDPYLTQQREPRRRLSSSECAEIESALEDCAAVRGCRSIENIERSMPATRVGQVRKMFHETTGLDADGFRSICERSCELGLTPSRGYIQREVCDGAVPGQWRRDIFED